MERVPTDRGGSLVVFAAIIMGVGYAGYRLGTASMDGKDMRGYVGMWVSETADKGEITFVKVTRRTINQKAATVIDSGKNWVIATTDGNSLHRPAPTKISWQFERIDGGMEINGDKYELDPSFDFSQ